MELEAIYDSRKSFYGKATVNKEKGIYNMFSYGVKICKYNITQQHNSGAYYQQKGES